MHVLRRNKGGGRGRRESYHSHTFLPQISATSGSHFHVIIIVVICWRFWNQENHSLHLSLKANLSNSVCLSVCLSLSLSLSLTLSLSLSPPLSLSLSLSLCSSVFHRLTGTVSNGRFMSLPYEITFSFTGETFS